jgi:hypothetical protein
MSATVRVNHWTTTHAASFYAGHQLVLPVAGTLEEDMKAAAEFFGCKVTELKFTTTDMPEAEFEKIKDADGEPHDEA